MAPGKTQALRPPPSWTTEQLRAGADRSVEIFRDERIKEPLEAYLDVFEQYRDAFNELLEHTVDLTQLSDHAISILTNPKWCEALRYIAAPWQGARAYPLTLTLCIDHADPVFGFAGSGGRCRPLPGRSWPRSS